MKEIIKRRWNRYKQIIFMYSVIFTVAVCCVTFFMPFSDAGFRSCIDHSARFILFMLVSNFLIETIGAILEFRQMKTKIKKEEDQGS